MVDRLGNNRSVGIRAQRGTVPHAHRAEGGHQGDPAPLAGLDSAGDGQRPPAIRHENALKAQFGSWALALTSVRAALVDVIAANRERYSNLRAFRNTLILVTGLLAVLIVAAAGWHALNPDFLSLCSDKSGCLDGSKTSQGTDVALVALVGAVAGLLAIAFAFSEVETAPSRYDPKTWQAFLKPVTGAATALLGVLLIQAEILAEPIGKSQAALLGYAALFGFSQQVLTQFVDKRASSLITPDH
jgi:hypothetical protein